jgi:hypothetical protein
VFYIISYPGRAVKQYYDSTHYVTYYIPASLKSVWITDETVLGYGAFCGCKKLTIFAKKGSYAEKYAKKHHICFVAKKQG